MPDISQINWLRLWVLNELVCGSRRARQFVYAPDFESNAYWTFPAGPAIHADPGQRLAVLQECADCNLIELHLRKSLENPQFDDSPSLVALYRGPLDVLHGEAGETIEAVLTRRGYDIWFSEFLPDWTRWWCLRNDLIDREQSRRCLQVIYAGNDILADLIAWLPTYWHLDPAIGLQQRSCRTLFQYQVGPHVAIPYAKLIDWDVREAPLLPLVTPESAQADSRKGGVALDKNSQAAQLGKEACRILERLSRVWGCATTSSSHRRDGNPVAIIAGQ